MAIAQTQKSRGAPVGNQNAVGNVGGGAPEGNQNAIGNSGGGAPQGNTNAQSHGVYCSLELIDARASGEVAKFIDLMEDAIRMNASEEPGELSREIPLRLIRYDRAVEDIERRGLVLEDGSENPMVPESRRILKRIFSDLSALEVV